MTDIPKDLVEKLLSLPDADLGHVLSEIARSGRLGHAAPPPSWDAIAHLMELESLTVGTHYVRDADRYRVASFSVPRLWEVEVLPSVQSHWRLAGATAVGEEFRGTQTKNWMKVVLSTPEDSAVMAIHEDPVAQAVDALDLADLSSALCLDGVSYRVTLQTRALRASFEFSNPIQGSLVALVRAILQLARTIALNSGNERLISRWNAA